MKIAFMHFHLTTGGVTAVIRQQATMLVHAGHEVLLITGGAPMDVMPAPVAVIPGLAYDHAGDGALDAELPAKAVLDALRNHWPGNGPDLLHVHNPTLAKNPRLQSVLKIVQQSGVKLLCQIHDFAEDGRPDVFFNEPYVADCHYAVVNDRDRRLLQNAGLKAHGVHYLPNAITPLGRRMAASVAEDQAPILYPVRAIRRKNIGEAILLRLFMDTRGPLSITLAPTSAGDIPVYNAWKAFTSRHALKVIFESGFQTDFSNLMAGCRFALTTSITEGFGFSFLEPWTAGKALWGRLLPEICRDFTLHGMQLDHLYTHLRVPLAWVDHEKLLRTWRQALMGTAQKYNHALQENRIDAGWQAISANDRIDFGLLNEFFQQAVILRLLDDGNARSHLMALNTFLQEPGPPRASHELIEHNQEVVRRHFSPDQCLRTLLRIYAQVMDCPVRHSIDKSILLDAFLTPERFSLLKWRPLHG